MQYAKRFWLDFDHEMTVAGVKVEPMKFSDEEFKLWLLWKLGYTLMKRKGVPAGKGGGLFEALQTNAETPAKHRPSPTNSLHPKPILRTSKRQ